MKFIPGVTVELMTACGYISQKETIFSTIHLSVESENTYSKSVQQQKVVLIFSRFMDCEAVPLCPVHKQKDTRFTVCCVTVVPF